jgi:hypothetical protein
MSPQADAVVIPLDVAARWLHYLSTGQAEPVRADLQRLMDDTRPPPDPPSSATRPISTR